ncbi:zinc chelation protein SecC, partial [Acinetobacter baumannii]|nr:zinc chelation protein SecC [Acinetobacter baumannii]
MKLIDMLNNIDTLLLSNTTNESLYKVALEEVSKLLENIQEQGDEDLSKFLWLLNTI